MGIALADAAASLGAEVELILGPVDLLPSDLTVKVTKVSDSDSMARETIKRFQEADITILAAAVADFKPALVSENKLKKKDADLTLNLIPTTDIALELGKRKTSSQILAGFALETENELDNAREKLKRKNLDFIVLNSLRDEGAGFGTNTNKITIIDLNNNIDKFELKSKDEAARDILEKVISLLNTQQR
jgi:phosphopantothenoylcysteine decarboxylase/phosphopantothenate--cysteine ligase